MALSMGTRLGTYEILGALGAGGMGEVYRAKDLRLGREIAIKVLPAEVSSSQDRLARLEREARTVAGLNHPNIVTLHSVEDAGGIRLLTMELVEGQTLSNLMAPGGLPLPELLELAIPLTDALVAAHGKGVIHRDLKPGNVMVTREGRLKVLDFGLARLLSADAPAARDQSLTVTAGGPISDEGHVAGTIPYMAPEQLRGETVDARSDLFALGIILYELATGRRPFTGESSIDVGHAILRDTPEPLGRVRADLPRDLERIISGCLEKIPRERIQTALDINNALRRLRKVLEPGEPRGASEKVASIAVLPFVNRSRDEEDEYFSDGLADELLSVLSKIKGLRVTARTSSFHFKGRDTTVADIGRALDVATVLEGSVRKAGKRIRVSVQLVNVSDSSNLWSETYDRTLEDIFAVQDDIAQSVVKELRSTLLGQEADSDARSRVKSEVASAAKGRGTDAEAHRFYLQARHFLDRLTHESTKKGIAYLERAIELEPDFALAWTELGRAHSVEAQFGWVAPHEGFGRARHAVERGLVLEPDLAEGHAVKGWIQLHELEFSGAERSLRRALDLAPGSALVLRWAGAAASSSGRIGEAIELYRRAIEHDPLSAAAYSNLGIALATEHHPEEAEKAHRKALELNPERIISHALLAEALLAQGRAEEALGEAMLEPHECRRLTTLAMVHHAAGRYEDSERTLREAKEKFGGGNAFEIAVVHAVRGEPDRAFEWLERAYTQKDPVLWEIKTDLTFDSLRGDPRWSALLKKLGLDT